MAVARRPAASNSVIGQCVRAAPPRLADASVTLVLDSMRLRHMQASGRWRTVPWTACISMSMPPEAWLNERVASGLCAAAADMSACPEKTGPGWLLDQILISNYTRKPVPAYALRGPYKTSSCRAVC